MAEDLCRQGVNITEAQAQAVAQFGSVRTLSQQLRRVHDYVGWSDVVLAALPILGITGLGWHFIGNVLPLWWYLLAFGWGALMAHQHNWPTWWYAWLGWLFLALAVVNETQVVFWVVFPLTITLIAIESWERATLMALPFTTYIAFIQLLGTSPLLGTTGWGPGRIYPGNIIWLETAFSLLWVGILALSIKMARPHQRGGYLLAGLILTQVLYLSAIFTSVILTNLWPDMFVSGLTVTLTVTRKLPLAALIFGLTIYPFLVFFITKWFRRTQRPGQPGLFAN